MRLTATEVLRRHVTERHLRYSTIRGVKLDPDDYEGEPRMSDAQWVDSLGLVRGVSRAALALLELYYTSRQGGTTWTVDAVEIAGEVVNVPAQQVAVRLTLKEAAYWAGLDLSYAEARALQRQAIEAIQDNMVRRAASEELAA